MNPLKIDQLKEGQRVRYVPNHAKGDSQHPDCETGVITSWHMSAAYSVTVYVRYDDDEHSKATRMDDLEVCR